MMSGLGGWVDRCLGSCVGQLGSLSKTRVIHLRAKSVAAPHRCFATATTGLSCLAPVKDARPAILRSRMSILALELTPSSRFSAF